MLGTYAKDFYAGRPAVTLNQYGEGKAIYVGTMSHQFFYYDLIVWLRQVCGLHPLLKVPDTVEVSMRQKDGTKIYFLLNHQHSPVRIQFYKPMHDFLTGTTLIGNYDLPPHGVEDHPLHQAPRLGEAAGRARQARRRHHPGPARRLSAHAADAHLGRPRVRGRAHR